MTRVGVIGVGEMGKNHARVYSELPSVELVGISDVDKGSLFPLAKKLKTKPFTDYNKLLKQDLDAVSVAVPTFLHKKVALDVANAGVNILIEKPIADTVKNAKKIINACKKKDVKLMVGHIERFNPIISVIKKKLYGQKILLLNIVRVGPFPPRIRDVGVVIDLAVHDIDLIRYLTNSEFRKVYGLTSKNISKYEDTAVLSFEMKNGILAQISTNWLTPFKIREINISTREKFIRGRFIEQRVTEYSKYKDNNSYIVKELKVPHKEPLKVELKAFLDSIKNNKEMPITGEDGLKVLDIALRCVK